MNAGKVGFEGRIFSGNPTLENLKKYSIDTTIEEKNFLENEVG
jgi:hypothetical protein